MECRRSSKSLSEENTGYSYQIRTRHSAAPEERHLGSFIVALTLPVFRGKNICLYVGASGHFLMLGK